MKKVSIKNLKKKKKGFTLVELIIVIAIIAILAAMAIPKFSAMRTDARVSNDVAKAKNIHTIAATLVANGTWKAGQTGLNSDNIAVTSRLDGGTNAGKAEALSAHPNFTITIGSNEDISVAVNSITLYPDPNETGRASYLALASGTGTGTGGTGTGDGTGGEKTE